LAEKPRTNEASVTPALLTGTSSEFLGRRPLPRILDERRALFVLGPEGSGKTCVGLHLARSRPGYAGTPLVLDVREFEKALVERVRKGAWPPRVLAAERLVLDGPVWLQNRAGAAEVLVGLLQDRLVRGQRTVVCLSDNDGSIDEILSRMESGSVAIVALRMPKGQRGRMRYAVRLCEDLGVDRRAALGTAQLEPWRYDKVLAHVRGWTVDLPGDEDVSVQP
jgi:hypothetical protein